VDSFSAKLSLDSICRGLLCGVKVRYHLWTLPLRS